MYTDASNEGGGGTLGQIQNGREVAITYAGRDFNSAEKNYITTEREALAVIFGIKKFEPYLYGRKFVLHTDHHSLKIFDIRHRPGAAYANADALSRRPYTLPSPSISAYDVPGVQTPRVRDLQCRDPDLSDLVQYLETWKLPDHNNTARSLLLKVDDYFLNEDGLLFHLWFPKDHRRSTTYQQLVIPTTLRYELLMWAHDNPTSGHLGTVKT